MMNKVELLKIAQLAKLSLSSEDIDAMLGTIPDIMGLVETINEVDLSQYDCSEEKVISELREDVVKPSLPVEILLSEAAEKHGNFYIV